MTIIERIKKDEILSKYLCQKCEEEGISLSLSSELSCNDNVIIKVDSYYSKEVKDPPKSVDYLILQGCSPKKYCIRLIELKSHNTNRRLNIKNIEDKYVNTLNDFMLKRFKEYFNIDYNKFKIYLISNIVDRGGNSRELTLGILLSKRFNWKGTDYFITYRSKSHTIQSC